MSQHKSNPRVAQFRQRNDGGLDAAVITDALGRELQPGDEVLVVMPTVTMRVAQITPILDPGAPPNLMKLVCVSQMMVAVQRNHGVEGMYLLRQAAEIQAGQRAAGQQAEPQEPATVTEN